MLSIGVTLIICALIATVLITNNPSSETIAAVNEQTFFVGVTYGGDNVADAKTLIDRVKGFTNLFIVQSGPLQGDIDAVNAICRYAADAGLYNIVYLSGANRDNCVGKFFSDFKVWESNLGVYFDDEPGGKMLDNSWNTHLFDPSTGYNVIKQSPEKMTVYTTFGSLRYSFNESEGWSVLMLVNSDQENGNEKVYLFETNSTIYNVDYHNGEIVSQVQDTSSLPIKSYQEIMAIRPYQTIDFAANIFVGNYQHNVEWLRNQSQRPVNVFTSDYGLYWFDYLSGYDVVLAQFGWNHTTAQDIALVRGAAEAQGKDWGAILTWKYTHAPYLASGDELLSQMNEAYFGGAKYVVLFNFADDMEGAYGTLQEEHFAALEQFWTNTLSNNAMEENPVVCTSTNVDIAVVLPKNFGGGLRNLQDNIWGTWGANEQSQQIWETIQSALEKHGPQLDIIYDDNMAAEKYSHLYSWNQTVS